MRIALLLCGQMRSFRFCFPSLAEYLLGPNNDHTFDVYISTQDCNSLKPRIDTSSVVNQYVVLRCSEDDIRREIKQTLGLGSDHNVNIKYLNVRATYQGYIANLSSELILNGQIGWMENFKDMQLCLEEALKEPNSYDFIIKTRPDILYSRNFAMPKEITDNTLYTYEVNNRFVWDTVFGLDVHAARTMIKFYDFYDKYARVFKEKTKAWTMEYNTEDHLYMFCKVNKINLCDIGDIGYPLSWLIGDIKHCEENAEYKTKRHKRYNSKWLRELYKYAKKCRPMIVDVYIN